MSAFIFDKTPAKFHSTSAVKSSWTTETISQSKEQGKSGFMMLMLLSLPCAHTAVNEGGHKEGGIQQAKKGIDPQKGFGDIVAQEVHVGVKTVQHKEDKHHQAQDDYSVLQGF